MKIGIFDSGIGGLNILYELKNKYKNIDFIYLADNKNFPYGIKSNEEIEKLSVNCSLILKNKNIDILIIGCNTASSISLKSIEKFIHPVKVYELILPTIKVLKKTLTNFEKYIKIPILIIGTKATIEKKVYINKIKELNNDKIEIYEKECSEFVNIIEEGNYEKINIKILEYLGNFMKYKNGIIILACSHYSFITKYIKIYFPSWTILDSSFCIIEELEIINMDKKKGKIEWIFTDDIVSKYILELIKEF